MSVTFKVAITTANQLLGCELVHQSPEGNAGGIIVETEAYTVDDAASHAFKGKTKRNAAMFLSGGHTYVYFTYGMHHCFNIVTGPDGEGQAVLIRALEPTVGLELMKQRRGRSDVHTLTNGPAKLVQALGITKEHSGKSLAQTGITLRQVLKPGAIISSPRRGISKAVDQPLRFYIANNHFVS